MSGSPTGIPDRAGGQGRYKLPLVNIPTHAARTVNFKQMIAAVQPDEDGNLTRRPRIFATARIEVADGRPLARIVITGSALGNGF